MANVPLQIAELKTLMKAHKETFEFLGPKPADATELNPTRMVFKRATPVPMSVVVAMPLGYPDSTPPVFTVQGDGLQEDVAEAIVEMLTTQASYMPGMECIATVLESLDDLDLSTLDLGTPGRCRAIFKVDIVNNSPNFSKSLKAATAGMPCIWLFRNIECQSNAKFSFAVDPYRGVHVIVDAEDKAAAVAFMKALRTDNNFDLDMLGKPCKLQMQIVEEFELAPKAQGVPEGYSNVEYTNDEEFDKLMNPYMAAVAAIKK